jgi:acyl-CoA dehydrogenase
MSTWPTLWLLGVLTLVALTLALPGSRRRLLIRPLLRGFRAVLPPLSATERAALEAGTLGWEGELFSGRPDWTALLSRPAPTLDPAEQAFLDGPVEELCRRLDDWRITHEERDLPADLWALLREHRFFGLIIPPEYGGLGFSALAHSAVVMKIASRSITAAVTVMVPNSLGPGKLLLHYGSERQRRHWLPRLARGEELPCFALTGPQAGSDAAAIPDRGVVCRGEHQGRPTLGIRLDWDKRYITLGPVATVLGLAFHLYDPQGLLGRTEDLGITLALIPAATPGIEIGRRHITLDVPFQNGPNRGRGVFIPLDWVIGERDGIGRGWPMLMECLAEGRGISLPALATAAAKSAARRTGAYARLRRQFGRPIGELEGVEEALARIAGLTYRMDAARRLLLAALDAGERPAVQSALVKYHVTEAYRQVINDAMDIQGGSGICLGPSNWIGCAYQSIPIAVTVEGANILTRNLILFGQGALRAHPWLLRELAAAQEPDQGRAEGAFDGAIRGHLAWLARNLGRTLMLGLSRGRLARVPGHGETRRWLRQLAWMSSAFALCADLTLMTLGGALKRRERLSARLGDVLSGLYLASAVLHRFEDGGRDPAELPLLRWALEDGLYRIQEALRGLWRNLPVRPLAWLLRALVFPTGLPYRGPGDRLDRQAARLLLAPSVVRDRLTEGIFTSSDPSLPEGRLEQALALAQRGDPLERAIERARRRGRLSSGEPEEALAAHIIQLQDLEPLRRLRRLRDALIQVDAFADYGRRNAHGGAQPGTRADAA